MIKLLKMLRTEKGAMTALAVLAIPVLIGFGAIVIDVGNLYVNKTQLQSAADSAALAAAKELPKDTTKASSKAYEYALKNGVPNTNVNVVYAKSNKSVTVTASRDVPFYLAPAMRMYDKTFTSTSSLISASATAELGPSAMVPWIVPFAIPKQQKFDYTSTFTMRMYDKDRPHGEYEFDYMNVSLGDMDFSQYLNYLKYGYKETLQVGDNLDYYARSSGGKSSVEAFADRVTRDSNSDISKAKVGDPRVMLIPIVDQMLSRDTSKGTDLKIVGFVGFFMESVTKGTIQRDGNYGVTFHAEGKFIKDLNVGSGPWTDDPNANFGLVSIKLTK